MNETGQPRSIDEHLRRPWRERDEANRQRRCDWPGCDGCGDYRAPRSREELRSWLWFCLDHVREYNRAWDYFAGMDREAIEAHRRDDVTWHRPTWIFGGAHGWAGRNGRFKDPFDLMGEDAAEARPGTGAEPPLDLRARDMINVMGMSFGFTLEELKARYKELVKRHHPDLNGGDKACEERLKSVIEAYRYLLEHELYM